MDTKNTLSSLEVKVWRGDAAGGEFRSYEVPMQSSQTVLDVVTWIQQKIDNTLSYRFSCRVGMCGSCAMTVNGEPRWTCRTHVSRVIRNSSLEIAPLRNLPVIKDLTTDMDAFFEKWTKAGGFHHPSSYRSDEMTPVDPASKNRLIASEGIECINCAVCYSACDTVAANPDYFGPAALQRAWTLLNDVKHNDKAGVLSAVSENGGCHNCHSHGSCTEYCPVELNPMKAVAGLKRATVSKLWRS